MFQFLYILFSKVSVLALGLTLLLIQCIPRALSLQLEWLDHESDHSPLSCAVVNPLKAELNPICHLLALLGVHFFHFSRIRVKSLTLRLLMSYIYVCVCACACACVCVCGAPILDVSRSHTTTHHSR